MGAHLPFLLVELRAVLLLLERLEESVDELRRARADVERRPGRDIRHVGELRGGSRRRAPPLPRALDAGSDRGARAVRGGGAFGSLLPFGSWERRFGATARRPLLPLQLLRVRAAVVEDPRGAAAVPVRARRRVVANRRPAVICPDLTGRDQWRRREWRGFQAARAARRGRRCAGRAAARAGQKHWRAWGLTSRLQTREKPDGAWNTRPWAAMPPSGNKSAVKT